MTAKYAVVVEDSLPTLKMLVAHLERAGYEVFPFQDGVGAWRFANAWGSPLDLILSDYQMPNMNGFELLELFQNSPIHRETPFIMVTGIQDKDLMLKSLGLGVSAFVVKPVTADTIARVITQISESASSKARILAVDDDKTCLELTSKILLAEGYSVQTSAGSAHALDSILTAIPDFDLIVSDVHMPDGSGFDLLTVIRSSGMRTPFLLMSGNSEIETLKHADQRALRLKFLDKGNLAHSLSSAVKQLLEQNAS